MEKEIRMTPSGNPGWPPFIVVLAVTGLPFLSAPGLAAPQASKPPEASSMMTLAEKKEAFGIQLFSPAGGFVLESGQLLSELVWQDPGLVETLTEESTIRTRWFDTQLEEVTRATSPGRYYAYGEATGPGGTEFRRAMTCVCLPDSLDLKTVARKRNASDPDSLLDAWQTTEAGAMELAALLEIGFLANEPRPGQWQMENASRQVQLKRKVLGFDEEPVQVRARSLSDAAPVLHSGSLAEAGLTAEQVETIGDQLDHWYASAGKPTAIVIARNGVVVLAKGYGELEAQPVTINTPMLLHSAMKPLIGCQLAMYVDRGIFRLDEPMGNYLADFQSESDHDLTFRAGHVHTTGIEFPWPLAFSRLFYFETWHESLIAHQPREWLPGEKFRYGVVGIILSVRALELKRGLNYWDAMERELFAPLGIHNIYPGGTGFSAENLARIGVMLSNRGKYGKWELFSEATYEAILPTSLEPYFPNIDRDYGIGLQDYERWFLPGSFGHAGGCGTQLVVYPEENLVFSMVRNQRGEGYMKHFADTMELLKAWVEN